MAYFLKASVLLMVFYGIYKILLQQDTFFKTNRWYLLSGLVLSILLPLVVIPVYITETSANPVFIIQNTTELANTAPMDKAFNWPLFLWCIYGLGVAVFGLRLGIQFFSLATLILRQKKQRFGKYIHVHTQDHISPFSFFNWIVYNPSQFKESELDQILIHEKIHVAQHHSIDILFTQILTVVFWFNPGIWLYKKALEQNLEFIADNETQKKTNCEKSYQQLLLKTCIPNYQLAFTNNFYNSLIKKRIIMLHTSKSHRRNQLKILILIPILTLFLMSFNTKEVYTNTVIDSVKKDAVTLATITKNTTDEMLNKTIETFKNVGVTIKFSNVKRNAKGAITKIGIAARSKNSKAKFEVDSEEPITTITIEYDNDLDSISIGSIDGNSFTFKSEDGKHLIKKSGKGSNIFVHSSSDHTNSSDIIEDEDKIIIRSNGNSKTLKNNTSHSSVHILSDDDSDHSKEEFIAIHNNNSKGVHITFDDDKTPYILLDGKEISKEALEQLDPDSIEKMEVIKGDDTVKKYGKKAKDGVVIITSKRKK